MSSTSCSAVARSTESSCPGWLSPTPGACSTQGPHRQEDAGRVSLCKAARSLANPQEHVCKMLMSECVRVSLTFAGTGFSVGGSDAAELRAGGQTAGREQAGHVGGVTKCGVCLHLRQLCLGAWCGMLNTTHSALAKARVGCVLCGTPEPCLPFT